MSFFVTSVHGPNGGDLGGLAGADAHCQQLAKEAGSRKRNWRAYLSASPHGRSPAVNARDRIGRGPWFNSKGFQIGASIEDLHGPDNHLGAQTSLDEQGNPVGYWHDMLTGSNPDGTLGSGDVTCQNWTSTQGHAIVGHSDKAGKYGGSQATSWNSAHRSSGCTLGSLQATGGDARIYCFAAD
jgi:hypothetical protein